MTDPDWPEPPPPTDEYNVISISDGRIELEGIYQGDIHSIEVLLSDHLGVLLGDARPLRLNSLTYEIEHAGKSYPLDVLVTMVRIAAISKVKCFTGKYDRITKKPIYAGLRLPKEDTKDVIVKIVKENEFSPIVEWLDSLPAVEPGVIELAGKEALGLTDELSLTLWRKWLISAVVRAYKPGEQVDHVLTLVAPKGGEGKSTTLRALAPWFSDTYLDINGYGRRDAYMQLHRTWIYEIPEIGRPKDVHDRGKIKSFITSPVDGFRAPYGATSDTTERHTIFAATTNSLDFLSSSDTAYNRRFWPIRVGKLDKEMIEKLRDQIWAEARDAYKVGELWHIPDDQVEMLDALSRRHEDLAEVEHPWEPLIQDWLESQTAEQFSLATIMKSALKFDEPKMGSKDADVVVEILRKLLWRNVKSNGRMVWRR